jgi:hypothetical protein
VKKRQLSAAPLLLIVFSDSSLSSQLSSKTPTTMSTIKSSTQVGNFVFFVESSTNEGGKKKSFCKIAESNDEDGLIMILENFSGTIKVIAEEAFPRTPVKAFKNARDSLLSPFSEEKKQTPQVKIADSDDESELDEELDDMFQETQQA